MVKKTKPKCPICGKTFKPHSNVKMHMKDAHGLTERLAQLELNKYYVDNTSFIEYLTTTKLWLYFMKLIDSIYGTR